jgi:hypothetical protein
MTQTMERVQLQPSRSAPDLTDLLEARSFDKRTSDDDAAVAMEDEDDEDDGGNIDDGDRRRWRTNHLPTPSPSRSPTPDVSHGDDSEYGRMRSETPEVYTRGEHARMHRSQGDDTAYMDEYVTNNHIDSQRDSESEGIHRPTRDDSLSPQPSTPTSGTRGRGLSNVGARFLPTSLWDYLREEISASELDGSQEMKAERVTNFFSVPMAVEQVSSCTPASDFSNTRSKHLHECTDHYIRLLCLLGLLPVHLYNPPPPFRDSRQEMGIKLFQAW